MPSRWEVALTGPRDVPVPPGAPQAVVSGWLDDRPQASGAEPAGRSAHSAAARAWACGPLRTCLTEAGGTVTVLEVRLLDDALAGRLAAARPGDGAAVACAGGAGGPADASSATPRRAGRGSATDGRAPEPLDGVLRVGLSPCRGVMVYWHGARVPLVKRVRLRGAIRREWKACRSGWLVDRRR